MFEFRDDFLMGPKANLENGEGGQFLCSASSSAEDQLAQLADLVGSGSTLKTAGSSKPVELVDSAPALEFDLEDELSKAFVAPTAPVEPAPAQHEVFDTQALEAALQQPVAEPSPLVAEEHPVEAVEPVAAPVDPSMEFSDMIADELDRALAEELADEVAADAAIEEAAHANEPEVVEVIDAAPEQAASTLPDIDAELSKLMGVEQPPEAPAAVETVMTEDAVSAAPAAPLQPPVPGLAQDPWVQPEIVDAPVMPSADLVAELPAAEPVAATQWQPPQMSDYEIVPEAPAQDFSDPAQEFQSFFEAETSAASAAPVSTDMAQPEPVPVDTSAYHVEAVLGGAAAMAGAATASAAYQDQPQQQPELGEAGVYAADPAAVAPEAYSDPAAIDMTSAYDQQDDIVIPPAHVASDPFQRKRSGKRAALAIVAVALLGGTAALGWNMVSGESGPAPTLLASTEPVKVKPKDAGGKVVPNQDQAVYRSVDGSDKDAPQQARLKDDSEEPIAVATSPVKKSETRIAAKATNGENGLILQPRRVRTVVVKPDGTIVSTTASTAPTTGGVEVPEPTLALTPTSPLPTVPATGAAEPSTKVSYSAPKADASATTTVAALAAKPVKVQPIKVTPVKVQPKPVVAAPKPVAVATPKPAAKTPVETAAVKPAATALPSTSSPYAVQIAAQRSAGAAERSYATLLKRYGSVLRGKGVDYKQVQVKGKTYFRIRIPAQSRSAANQLCGSLKSRGGSCFVTR